MGCGHTFAWHGVVPPSHCPTCGRCLGCGQGAAPLAPRPTYPRPVAPYPLPYWQSPYTNTMRVWS